MSRYETFVIRLWVGDGADPGHGELRHLTRGTVFRFRQVQEALRLIESIAGGEAEDQQRLNRQVKKALQG
jgi:hypothetical protein